MGDIKTREPGQLIRPPVFYFDQIADLISHRYGLNMTSYKELVSHDDRNYLVIVNDNCSNNHITTVRKDGYVLKILNKIDSKNLDYPEAMNSILLHIKNGGMRVSQPQPNKQGALFSLETFDHGDTGIDVCVVCLLDFIPGKELGRVPLVPRLIYKVGKYVGRLDNVLKSFSHAYYDKHMTPWSLHWVPELAQHTHVVRDEADRQTLNEVIDAFNREVVPLYDILTPGIIHGDANEENILVTECDNNHNDVVAIIDMGDSSKGYIAFEMAILIAYVMMNSKIVDPLDAGGHVLAGYLTETHLNQTDRDVLRVLVASRIAQSIIMGIMSHKAEPGNEYLLSSSVKCWPCLRNLWRCCKSDLYARWESVINKYANTSD